MSSVSLPQLDFATYDSQIFWLIITFSILYFSISKVFLPNIVNLIKNRESYTNEILNSVSLEDDKISSLESEKNQLNDKNTKEVGEILDYAKREVGKINQENGRNIEANLRAMANELRADLNSIVESNRDDYENQCSEIFNVFSEKYKLKASLGDNLKVTFNSNWSNKVNKIISRVKK